MSDRLILPAREIGFLGRSPAEPSTTFTVYAYLDRREKFRCPIYARTSLLALQAAQETFDLLSNTEVDGLTWEVRPA